MAAAQVAESAPIVEDAFLMVAPYFLGLVMQGVITLFTASGNANGYSWTRRDSLPAYGPSHTLLIYARMVVWQIEPSLYSEIAGING